MLSLSGLLSLHYCKSVRRGLSSLGFLAYRLYQGSSSAGVIGLCSTQFRPRSLTCSTPTVDIYKPEWGRKSKLHPTCLMWCAEVCSPRTPLTVHPQELFSLSHRHIHIFYFGLSSCELAFFTWSILSFRFFLKDETAPRLYRFRQSTFQTSPMYVPSHHPFETLFRINSWCSYIADRYFHCWLGGDLSASICEFLILHLRNRYQPCIVGHAGMFEKLTDSHGPNNSVFLALQDSDLAVAPIMAQTTLYASVLLAARACVLPSVMDDFSDDIHTNEVNYRINPRISEVELGKASVCTHKSPEKQDKVICQSFCIRFLPCSVHQ